MLIVSSMLASPCIQQLQITVRVNNKKIVLSLSIKLEQMLIGCTVVMTKTKAAKKAENRVMKINL